MHSIVFIWSTALVVTSGILHFGMLSMYETECPILPVVAKIVDVKGYLFKWSHSWRSNSSFLPLFVQETLITFCLNVCELNSQNQSNLYQLEFYNLPHRVGLVGFSSNFFNISYRLMLNLITNMRTHVEYFTQGRSLYMKQDIKHEPWLLTFEKQMLMNSLVGNGTTYCVYFV